MLIQLSNGMPCMIDEDQFKYISQWKWKFHKDGYAYRTQFLPKINGKRKSISIYMHREVTKAPKGLMVDHINHNRLDNRGCNLRLVTNSQNQLNRRFQGLGVYFDKSRLKWMAYLKLDGKMKNLGRYNTVEEALVARKAFI